MIGSDVEYTEGRISKLEESKGGVKRMSDREWFLEEFERTMSKMVDTCKRKNHDYSGDNDDPFANLSMCEKVGITDTVKGTLVRMCDKFSRITTFANKGVLKVKDESIEDTLEDLAVYSVMLKCYIKLKKLKNSAK